MQKNSQKLTYNQLLYNLYILFYFSRIYFKVQTLIKKNFKESPIGKAINQTVDMFKATKDNFDVFVLRCQTTN